MVSIALRVNGKQVTKEVEPRRLLVKLLRENLRLTGTHVGCDTSQCGACTVMVDGSSVKSCTMLAVEANGREVTTIEGLAENGKMHPMLENIELSHGDTNKTSFGMGTYGSRSLAVGGAAIVKATGKIVEKAGKIAAHLLEADVADIDFVDGNFVVKGTDRMKAFGEVAFAAYVPHNFPYATMEPGLEESAFYDPGNFTFPGGTHIVEVEIDPETGQVTVVDVAVADDVGTIIISVVSARATGPASGRRPPRHARSIADRGELSILRLLLGSRHAAAADRRLA